MFEQEAMIVWTNLFFYATGSFFAATVACFSFCQLVALGFGQGYNASCKSGEHGIVASIFQNETLYGQQMII